MCFSSMQDFPADLKNILKPGCRSQLLVYDLQNNCVLFILVFVNVCYLLLLNSQCCSETYNYKSHRIEWPTVLYC